MACWLTTPSQISVTVSVTETEQAIAVVNDHDNIHVASFYFW